MMKALFNDIKYEANLGQIARHGYCFGVDEIFLTEKQRTLHERRTIKCSAKYYGKTPITKVNLQNFLENYKGRKICPIPEKNCKKLEEFKFKEDDLLIFGNEDNVPNEIKEQADEFLYIPMEEKIKMQCLNLATSFSIIAFEQWRQRNAI